jgi:D-alanyl-D-alanine carboxypeptidase
MKILIIVGITLLLLVIVIGTLLWLSSRPITKDRATSEIQRIIEGSLNDKKSIHSALIYIVIPEKDFQVKYAAGISNGEPIQTNQPFHVASVGKLFTATLIGRLIDEGKIRLNDPIHLYLDNALLENLFIFEGVDNKDQVTIQHLLSHTSGVADYFAKEDNGLVESLYQSPDTFFTPQAMVQYTRDHQSAYFAPGDGYHYSDTGYVLLGLIIESVTGKPFHENLQEVIFEPLGMKDTYLMFYSEPENGKKPIAEIWVNGHEVSQFQSVSIDWAGGGVVSTLDDLATYIRALYQNRIISPETLEDLNKFDHDFMPGIAYGNGIMQMQFEKFFPTLGFLPRMTGHMGVLGTQLFYDKSTDLVYVSSFGSSDATDESVKTMIKILTLVNRIH